MNAKPARRDSGERAGAAGENTDLDAQKNAKPPAHQRVWARTAANI